MEKNCLGSNIPGFWRQSPLQVVEISIYDLFIFHYLQFLIHLLLGPWPSLTIAQKVSLCRNWVFLFSSAIAFYFNTVYYRKPPSGLQKCLSAVLQNMCYSSWTNFYRNDINAVPTSPALGQTAFSIFKALTQPSYKFIKNYSPVSTSFQMTCCLQGPSQRPPVKNVSLFYS